MEFESKLEEVKNLAIKSFEDSMNEELLLHNIHDSIHGVSHWEKVHANALMLSNQEGVDSVVVRLFAYLHDCRRNDDGIDSEHGYRASLFVKHLYMDGVLSFLTDEQLEKLTNACEYHNTGDVSEDPTIGACYDSDRIELIRCGITPKPELMNTELGKWIASRMQYHKEQVMGMIETHIDL